MSQTTFLTGGWGYWPSSDRYPLEPVWKEWHTCQSLTVSCRDEEVAWLDVVLRHNHPWSINVTMTDLGEDLDSDADDAPPTVFVRAESRIWKEWGWQVPMSLSVTPVLVDGAWAGEVRIEVTHELLDQLGVNVIHRYEVDVWLGDEEDPDAEFPVRIMMGHMVVR